MGCYYWIEAVTFPNEARERVKQMLEAHDLADRFEFGNEDGEYGGVWLTEGDMSHHSAGEIDDFLDEMAALVKGTARDGQLIAYDYENESRGVHVLVDGQRHEFAAENIMCHTETQLKIGEQHVVNMDVQVLALPDKHALIIGVPA